MTAPIVKKQGRTMKMTDGNIVKQLLVFSAPLFLSSLVAHLYSLFDTKIVGDILGNTAFTAIGATGSIYGTFISFANGITYGFSIVVANRFGASDETNMRRAVATSYLLTLIVSVTITVLEVIFMGDLLLLLNTPDELFDMAKTYLIVVTLGTPINCFANLCGNLLRSVGNSVVSLILNIISTFINIGLDIVLMTYTDLGVAGAALATVVAQAFTAVSCYIYIKIRMPFLAIPKERIRPSRNEVGNMLKLGISVGAMGSFVSLGSMAVQRALNGLEIKTMTAFVAARRFDEFMMMVSATIGNAIAIFSGQNFGCGKYKRMRQGVKYALILCFAWCALATLLVFTVAPAFISWLTSSNDPEIINTAVYYLKLNVPFTFILAIMHVFRNVSQGTGNTFVPAFSGAIEFAVKVAVAFGLTSTLGFLAICICEPISWFGMAVLSVIAYINLMKKYPKTDTLS